MKVQITIGIDFTIDQKLDLSNRMADIIVGEFNVPVEEYEIEIIEK